MTHPFVWHRDRIARPDDPTDAMAIESQLRKPGLALVCATGPTLSSLALAVRAEPGDLLMSAPEGRPRTGRGV